MDAKARIKELMAERNWSEYRLAIAIYKLWFKFLIIKYGRHWIGN